jgi:hypothetical protein
MSSGLDGWSVAHVRATDKPILTRALRCLLFSEEVRPRDRSRTNSRTDRRDVLGRHLDSASAMYIDPFLREDNASVGAHSDDSSVHNGWSDEEHAHPKREEGAANE